MFQQPFLPPPFFDPERIIKREMIGQENQPDLEEQAEETGQEIAPRFSLARWIDRTFRARPIPHR